MKYVFWIHSSTSYYMAKAIIAKENLDCHNVVYLIDRNYANKYHNNIDIEIEDISFWMNNDNIRTKFINEGIGVCFDQQKNEKLKIAQKTYKTNQIDIKEIWRNQTKLNDDILYPISGAFVNFLIEYDKSYSASYHNRVQESIIRIPTLTL